MCVLIHVLCGTICSGPEKPNSSNYKVTSGLLLSSAKDMKFVAAAECPVGRLQAKEACL